NQFIEQYDYGNFWKIILSEISIDQSSWIKFPNPTYLIFLKHLLKLTDLSIRSVDLSILDLIKNYLTYCIILKYGPYMKIAPILAKLSPLSFDEKKIYRQIFIDRV